MSDSDPPDGIQHHRPGPTPFANRMAPSVPSTTRNTLTGLLGRNPGASTPIPPGLQAKMAAMANRGTTAQPTSANSFAMDSATEALARASLATADPTATTPRAHSFPVPSRGSGRGGGGGVGGLAAKRAKPSFKLSDINGGDIVGGGAAGAGLGLGRPNLFDRPTNPPRRPNSNSNFASPFSNFGKIVDPSGALNFSGKAVLHASGVDFSNGSSFAINMEQLQLDEELGKGNYGTVKKVLHRPTNVAMAMK
ncbi:hypothetical protein PILCRDRAFT_16448, partial [Piloderma croceum F 1598]